MYGSIIEFRAEVKSDINSLREDLNALNDSVSNLSVCLQEHKKQTTPELAQLQTSLNSTQSSLANQMGQFSNNMDRLSSNLDTLSQYQHHISSELTHLQTSLNYTQYPFDNQTGQLNNKVDGLSSKLDTLNTTLYQHQHHTATELAHLQTSLNSTQSSLENISSKLNSTQSYMETKLDSLTATTAQLSSDHQQIQDNISDVECLDTEQSLELHQIMQDNLTHQLEEIKEDVKFIVEQHWCGGTGGWRRVVHLDMTDPNTTCPSGWNMMTGYSKRTCGRNNTGADTCDSVSFPVSGAQYSRICGRIRAYQWGENSAFYSYHNGRVTTIDGVYVSGVSVTHGTPRTHIWTFAAGATENDDGGTDLCPCDTNRNISVPLFVGEDYFCESGFNEPWVNSKRYYTFHSNDTLWDGEDCLPSSTCCSLHNPPYFAKQLPTSTTDDIEARICVWEALYLANIAVELVELYVQ